MLADENETYLVPGEIAVALSTGRPMMINPLYRRLTEGDEIFVLSREHQAELVRLLRDLIEDKIALKDKLRRVTLNLEAKVEVLQEVSTMIRDAL